MTVAAAPRAGGPSDPTWAQFAGWTLVGALGLLALLTGVTIGPFVAPVALVGLIRMLRWAPNTAAAGLLCGPAVVLAYVAWVHRRGPGGYCDETADGMTCVYGLWDPRPIAAVASLLLVGGPLLIAWARRRAARG